LFVNGDATRLAQVVVNLLNNAAKFTDRGGHVRVSVERSGEHARIRVADDGIGIGSDQLDRIFELFTQVDTSLERSRSGLGIGLTLAKTLVELHDGTIAVQSDGLGRGSEFTVTLPLFVETADADSSSSSSPGISPVSRRILVVDDNRDAAEALSELLQIRGHETRTAFDGLEALQIAEAFRPEVVLLDIGLPKLNGYEVAQQLRREPWARSITLIALTGWGQDDDRRRTREAGFDAHLVKPVDHALLAKLLLAPS
jgi:CheY-like chemotaxis protein/anti-sigma regulatory factor (Ser/Thr protein kinase)